MNSVSEWICAAEHLQERHYTHLSQGKWNDTKNGKQLYSYVQHVQDILRIDSMENLGTVAY